MKNIEKWLRHKLPKRHLQLLRSATEFPVVWKRQWKVSKKNREYSQKYSLVERLKETAHYAWTYAKM